LAVENAQLYEDAVKRLDRLAALQGVSLAVSASPDLRLTLKVILDHVTAQLKVDAADVMLLDETDNTLSLAASTGFLATAVPDYRLPADEGMPGQSLMSRRIETVTALSAFSQFRRRSLFAREGFKSYGAVPLISRLEREIMRLVVEGKTNREVAAEVHLSQNTVKFHMRQILQKSGASNRTDLAHQAAKEGWL